MSDGEMTVAQLAERVTDHLADCYNVRRETKDALKALVDRFDTLNRTAWKAVGAIALVILAAAATATAGIIVANVNDANETRQTAFAVSEAADVSRHQDTKAILNAVQNH